MTEQLKVCPFCGCKGKLYQSYEGSFVVQCRKCGITTLHKRTPDEVIGIWNTRRASSEEVYELMKKFAECQPHEVSGLKMRARDLLAKQP